jgi:hypothetical protein
MGREVLNDKLLRSPVPQVLPLNTLNDFERPKNFNINFNIAELRTKVSSYR